MIQIIQNKIINIINKHFNIKINIYCEDGRTSRGGVLDKQVINFDYVKSQIENLIT